MYEGTHHSYNVKRMLVLLGKDVLHFISFVRFSIVQIILQHTADLTSYENSYHTNWNITIEEKGLKILFYFLQLA